LWRRPPPGAALDPLIHLERRFRHVSAARIGTAKEGLGVGRDDVQAFKWFAIAAARGTDAYARSNAVQGRNAVAARLTPDQVAQAERLAAGWTAKLERH
jgi:hypothetical protein